MTDGMIEAEFRKHMGAVLAAKRKQRGLSQEDVGNFVGVHRNTIRRWERGEYQVYAWQLLRLADVLACDPMLFLTKEAA